MAVKLNTLETYRLPVQGYRLSALPQLYKNVITIPM